MVKYILTALIILSFMSCKSTRELPTVDELDINKYAGKWYEIARLPNSFEKGLECVTATYTVLENGKIEVLNSGIRAEDKSRQKDIKGSAWVADSRFPGRLKVRFFWPQSADYYVLALDNEYKYALVGSPSRKYLWILSKSKTIADSTYDELLKLAKKYEFPVENMIRVNQDCNMN